MDITKHIVRDVNGIINQDMTIENVRKALSIKAEEELQINVKLSAAIHDVFDGCNMGSRLPMPSLCLGVAAKMGTHPARLSELTAQVNSFVRSSSNVFHISRGRNGGVLRLIKPE